jgi:nucleoside triphosphatase
MARQRFPEPTVGALVFNLDGKIFLMKSHKMKGRFTVPGGHIELGERIEDALKREIKEETGLNIFEIKFICVQEFIFDNAFWKKKHFIFLDYICKTDSSKVELNSESQEYIWSTLEEALNLPTEPYTRRLIEEHMKRNTLNNSG